MAKHRSSFDFILDAVSAQHDINAYLSLLAVDGALVNVGAPPEPLPVQDVQSARHLAAIAAKHAR